jgi:hypothetical protein
MYNTALYFFDILGGLHGSLLPLAPPSSSSSCPCPAWWAREWVCSASNTCTTESSFCHIILLENICQINDKYILFLIFWASQRSSHLMLRGGSFVAPGGAHTKVTPLLGSFYNCGCYGGTHLHFWWVFLQLWVAHTYGFGMTFYNCG